MQDENLTYLLNNDPKGVKLIYDQYLPRITAIISKLGGSKDEAWEVFQESLIVILSKAKDPDFQLTSSFYTFLVSVAKFKWYNESKKKYKSSVTIDDKTTLISDDDVVSSIQKLERYKLYKQKLGEMGPSCQEILRYFLEKVPLKEIAVIMGFASENAAKQKKYKCQQKLIASIKADRNFKEY